jgi:hypothetical protein
MTAWPISERERLLLNAALSRDPAIAVASWQAWTAQIALEDAPRPELRLLTAVHGNLTRIAPQFNLPPKLRGKAKANFAKTNLLAQATLPLIEELGRYSPVMLTKGMAICIRFGAWSSRSLFDVDFHVPTEALNKAYQVLAEAGWTPAFGISRLSLLHRSRMRRISWNFRKGPAEIDLHWRLLNTSSEAWLAEQMWATGEQVEFGGRRLLLQSPEFALLSSLHHGFVTGTPPDALQTIVDSAALLPICGTERLLLSLRKAELLEEFEGLLSICNEAGLSDIVPAEFRDRSQATMLPARRPRVRSGTETELLRRPARYRLWELLGRKAKLERYLIRLGGPISKPLTGPAPRQEEYDLRDCAVVDHLAGPGWGEPDRSSFWTDRADARLLIPLRHAGDHLLVLGMPEQRLESRYAEIHIFANGTFLTTIDLRARLAASEYCVPIPRRALFGPWVEISLRPKDYLGDAQLASDDDALVRGVPVRRLRLLDMKRMNEIFSAENKPELQVRVLRGEEPERSKFARIKRKIENSPHRQASEVPEDFDPELYVFSYPDLFEHEVDPYEHFLLYGRKESRGWR